MNTSKIIRGVVSNGRYTVTAPIVKEDYGLYLQIEGVELPSTYEVDFSNSESNGTSVTMIGNADGVLIPHQFIDTGKDIFAFLYHVGADFGRTVYKFRIPNKVRPDRTDETPTPEEQSTIDQAISALNTAVEQTAEDVNTTAENASRAYDYADEADSSATDARNYANNAQTSANNASASASQASASATASAQSASDAETARQAATSLVAEAQRYANASEQSAQASATSASQAQGFAQSASASAQSASDYASQAQTSANTASAKAQDASQNATTASQKATESAQSASQALGYKTDAESAKVASQTAQGLAESAKDSAISAKNDAESARDDAESARDAVQSSAAQITTNTEDITQLKEDLSDIFQTVTDYAIDVASITGINTLLNQSSWNGGSYIGIDPNASYDSYWFVTDRDIDVYINPSVIPTYLAIVVGNAFTSKTMSGNTTRLNCGGTITRYRTLENNLPTSANKLHIPSGSAVAFTMTTGYTVPIYGIGEPYNEVKESFKNEVVGSKFLRYISGNGADSSTERVEIYIPNVSGYIRYDFLHCVDASINADVWRIGYAYHTDDNFIADYAITTTGEWECALKISGRSDFSGGIIHGDEVVQDITFVLDGTPVDITAYTSITAFTDLSIIENTKMYDPNDSSTVFANHGSEHAFIGDELVIRQSVKYVLAETIALGYMAMFPIAKAVSSILVPNSDFVPITLTGGSLVLKDTNNVTLYHPSGKVKAEFSIPTYDHFAGNLETFMCNDNGGSMYNKCYYITTFFDSSVPVGKLSKTETRYRIIAK